MEEICKNCEYYDDGTGIKRTGTLGDCHNSLAPHFQVRPNQVSSCFYPNSSLNEDGTEKKGVKDE